MEFGDETLESTNRLLHDLERKLSIGSTASSTQSATSHGSVVRNTANSGLARRSIQSSVLRYLHSSDFDPESVYAERQNKFSTAFGREYSPVSAHKAESPEYDLDEYTYDSDGSFPSATCGNTTTSVGSGNTTTSVGSGSTQHRATHSSGDIAAVGKDDETPGDTASTTHRGRGDGGVSKAADASSTRDIPPRDAGDFPLHDAGDSPLHGTHDTPPHDTHATHDTHDTHGSPGSHPHDSADSSLDYDYYTDDVGDWDDDWDDMLLPPSPPRSPPRDLDPAKLYGLYDFSGPDPSHCTLARDEPVELVNDDDSYWWLVRKMTRAERAALALRRGVDVPSDGEDGKVGFVPAECLETHVERLARLNCYRNEDLEKRPGSGEHSGHAPEASAGPRKPRRRVTFEGVADLNWDDDDEFVAVEAPYYRVGEVPVASPSPEVLSEVYSDTPLVVAKRGEREDVGGRSGEAVASEAETGDLGDLVSGDLPDSPDLPGSPDLPDSPDSPRDSGVPPRDSGVPARQAGAHSPDSPDARKRRRPKRAVSRSPILGRLDELTEKLAEIEHYL